MSTNQFQLQVILEDLQKQVSTSYCLLQRKTLPVHFSITVVGLIGTTKISGRREGTCLGHAQVQMSRSDKEKNILRDPS